MINFEYGLYKFVKCLKQIFGEYQTLYKKF